MKKKKIFEYIKLRITKNAKQDLDFNKSQKVLKDRILLQAYCCYYTILIIYRKKINHDQHCNLIEV